MQQQRFINNSNQPNIFRAMIRPSSGALDCVYSLWYNAPTILPAGILDAEELGVATAGVEGYGQDNSPEPHRGSNPVASSP
jgi:hypothetical protein